MKLEIGSFLRDVEDNGIESVTENLVERLEYFILSCNMNHNAGTPLVEDAVYDKLVEILEQVSPNSHLLKQVWSEDSEVELDADLNKFLFEYPMKSIRTVKNLSYEDLSWFIDKLPDTFDLFFSLKENGHGIRLVYNCGYLELATTRGRSTAGRDITSHLRVLLGDTCESLIDQGVVELRAELVLPFSNLEEARGFNPDIKSAFTAVSSMSRESATEAEICLLRVVAYDILGDNLDFATLSDKYEFIESLGFETPLAWSVEDVSKYEFMETLNSVWTDIESASSEYDYYTDGIVMSVNNLALFDSLGDDNCKYRFGNAALKVGKWQQDLYSAEILEVNWISGKTKLTPVAIVEGVLTETGNTVTNIPLYGPNYILLLEAYPGNIIHFRYGGEAGVIPTTADGIPLTKAFIQNSVDDDYVEELDNW